MRTIIVTGASSGIGERTSLRLLEEGYNVVGIARNMEKIGFNSAFFHPIELDIANIDQLPAALKSLSHRFNDVTGLVCCAGRGQFGSLEEFSYTQLKELMDINFLSHACFAKAFTPMMKKKQSGDIIFLGSEAALSGSKYGAIYCASKFALRGFSQALRHECSSSGVKVTLINPGMVNTPFFDTLHFTPGENPENYIDAKDIADTIAMLLKLRQGTVVDEINLSPLKRVFLHKISNTDSSETP